MCVSPDVKSVAEMSLAVLCVSGFSLKYPIRYIGMYLIKVPMKAYTLRLGKLLATLHIPSAIPLAHSFVEHCDTASLTLYTL